jgi:DHA2 family multidrug resistance protein-like MFS transporter
VTASVAPPLAGPREWVGLVVLVLACLLYAMDLTVLHLAVPSLSAALQPSSAQLLWITDIYGFMVAGFLITLGDRIGRRRLLLWGASAFGVISVLAALATPPRPRSSPSRSFGRVRAASPARVNASPSRSKAPSILSRSHRR